MVVKIVRNNCFKQPDVNLRLNLYPNACGHKIADLRNFKGVGVLIYMSLALAIFKKINRKNQQPKYKLNYYVFLSVFVLLI